MGQEFKTRDDMIHELIFGGFFILSFIIIVPFMWKCLPEGSWHDGTVAHTYFRYFWWTCSLAIFYISYTAGKHKDNLIGLLCSMFLGPVPLLTLAFYYVYIKLKNGKTFSI